MSQATSPRLLTTNRNVSSLRFLKFSFPVTPYQLAGKGSGGGGEEEEEEEEKKLRRERI